MTTLPHSHTDFPVRKQSVLLLQKIAVSIARLPLNSPVLWAGVWHIRVIGDRHEMRAYPSGRSGCKIQDLQNRQRVYRTVPASKSPAKMHGTNRALSFRSKCTRCCTGERTVSHEMCKVRAGRREDLGDHTLIFFMTNQGEFFLQQLNCSHNKNRENC